MSRPPLPIGTWGGISTRIEKTDMNGKPAKHQSQTKFRDCGGSSVNPVREVDTIEAPPKDPPRALTSEERDEL